MNLMFGILVSIALLCACSKRPPTAPFPPTLKPEAQAMPDPNEPILTFEKEAAEAPISPIFFGYNSYSLKEPYKAAALAAFLRKTGKGVFLSGHTSQEGATDYNLALGARRAQSVRAYLEAAGVPENRIRWQSFGEEKPVTEDPNLYHLNRRVEIAVEDLK